jgi:hypothetical protein
MKTAFTTTIDPKLLAFLTREAKKEKVYRNTILEKALKLYKNMRLQMEVEKGMKDRYDEYKAINQEFFLAQKKIFEKI